MRYESQAFKNETITLDGNEFYNCTFEGCTLEVAGTAPFKLEPFDVSSVNVRFIDAAKIGADFQRELITLAARTVGVGAHLQIGDTWFKMLAEKPDGIPD